VLSATISFWLARHWLADFDGWSLIWRSAILGWITSNIGLAVAAAKGAGGLAQTAPIRMHSLPTPRIVHNVIFPIMERSGPVFGAIIGGIIATAAGAPRGFGVDAALLSAIAPVFAAVVAIIATATGTPLELGVDAAFLGALAPLLVFLLSSRLEDGSFDFRNRAKLATSAIGVILIFGVAVGYLLRALLIRFAVTLYYWKDGLIALPINWRRTLFSTDLATPPELIPGYIGSSHFNFRFTYESLRSRESWDDRDIFNLICAFFYFLPAYFYRLTIKSTFWLYWPFAYVATGYTEENTRPAVFMDRLSATPLAWLSFLLAATTVLTFVIENFFSNRIYVST
jgi:hypothetical protein